MPTIGYWSMYWWAFVLGTAVCFAVGAWAWGIVLAVAALAVVTFLVQAERRAD